MKLKNQVLFFLWASKNRDNGLMVYFISKRSLGRMNDVGHKSASIIDDHGNQCYMDSHFNEWILFFKDNANLKAML